MWRFLRRTTAEPSWPERTGRGVAQGEIKLGDGDGNPSTAQEPLIRLVIDLYSLDCSVTVKYLIPQGSELEQAFQRGPTQVEGWKTLVTALKRNLDEIVEIHARKWWTPDQALFRVGDRVRIVGDPNYPLAATGTIAASPGPRRVSPGVVYRVTFDEPQVNQPTSKPYPEADVLKCYVQPLDLQGE